MKKIALKIRPFHTSVNTKFLVLLLMLMFVDYAGYGFYIFYLPFAYLFFHKAFKVDWTFLLLLMWGISYGFTNYAKSGLLGYAPVWLPIVNCPVLYIAGKYIAHHNDSKNIVLILYLFAFSIALISLLSVCSDIVKNGFLVVGFARNIPLIGMDNSEGYMAATGISSRLMLLTSFFVFIMLPYNWLKKILFSMGALLAIYCAVRVQSRTTIVGLSLILFTVVIGSLKSLSNKQKCILFLGLGVIVYAIIYILSHYDNELAIINRFQSDEIETGGGRMDRLMYVAIHMWSHPFGMDSNIEYAHNLWFDCARLVGIVPFLLLVILSLKYAWSLYVNMRNNFIDLILRYTLWILSIAILIVFLAEPVLEGIPMIYEFFCFLFGINMYYVKKYKFSHLKFNAS